MKTSEAFDPISELLVGNFEKPADLQEVNLRALTPFQRALLVIDGTVTKFIEAYSMEQVEVRLQEQYEKHLTEWHQFLEAPKATKVLVRSVSLRGRFSHKVYAHGISLIVPDRLPPADKKEFESGKESIGRILLNSRIEQYRELLWYGRETIKQPPAGMKDMAAGDFLSRTYRITSGQRPVILINEKFPLLEDNRPDHH